MGLRRLVILTVAAALLLPLAGCSDQPDHYARALAVERELRRQAPDAGFDDHRYIVVLKELRKVPRGHKHRARADAMEQRIRDGRRVAAATKYPAAAKLPPRLAAIADAGSAPAPAALPDAAVESAPASKTAPAAEPSGEAAPLDVVLYSTSWCGYCRRARNWFTTNGVPFVEKDIEKDRAAHAEYQRIGRGYSGVPLISVNGAVIRGFDQRAVQREITKVRRAGNPG